MSIQFDRLGPQDEKLLQAVYRAHPGNFALNQPHWEAWGMDHHTCGHIVRGLIEDIGFLRDAGPPSGNLAFPRILALTDTGLEYCKWRWPNLNK